MNSGILGQIERYERLRSEGLNLIASENYLSPGVRKALASELGGRYHTEWYGGSGIAREIIEATESLARKLFRAKHAIVTPLSGNICDLTVLFAFTAPGEKVAMVPFSGGGYPLGVAKFHRSQVFLPVNEDTLEINLAAAKKLTTEQDVRLTMLGASFILFPQPVREISSWTGKRGKRRHCVYDGSHVLGLIASGEFQDPLEEGAEVLFGSTHKSLYGPQGGIILTNSPEHADRLREFLEIDLETGIGLVDNPHVNRVAALGVALEEMLEDPGYGKRVIENAKALARALDELQVPVRFKDRDYTESHQILLDLEPRRAQEFCHELETIGIFVDEGARIGVAEVTHRGMGTVEMVQVAELLGEAYLKGAGAEIRKRVRQLAERTGS